MAQLMTGTKKSDDGENVIYNFWNNGEEKAILSVNKKTFEILY